MHDHSFITDTDDPMATARMLVFTLLGSVFFWGGVVLMVLM